LGERNFTVSADNTFGLDEKKLEHLQRRVRDVINNVSAGGNMYMFNCHLDFDEDANLLKELQIDRVAPHIRPIIVQFFLGKARIGEKRIGGSELHCAALPNLNFQLSGSKKWRIIESKYYKWLNVNLLQGQFAAVVNMKWPPEIRYTNFPRFEATLNPGDALYIPPWTYHEVEMIPGPDWQISIALRFSKVMASYKNNLWYSLLSDLGVRGRPFIPGLRLPMLDFSPPPKTQSEKQNGAITEYKLVPKKFVDVTTDYDYE